MALSALLTQAQPHVIAAAQALPDQLSADNSATDKLSCSRYILFFSITDGQQRARIVRAAGEHLQQAWQDGARRCQREAQRHKLDVSWLRIDWVSAAQATTWGELAGRLSKTKRNYFRYGLALDGELTQAFLEPELNANAMLYVGADQVAAGLNERNFAIHARKRFGQKITLDFSAQTPVWLFAHQGVFFTDDPALAALPAESDTAEHSAQTAQAEQTTPPVLWLPGNSDLQADWRAAQNLNAGRRQIACLQPDQVHALIDSSADFLARQVHENGRFTYGHFPCFGRTIANYNALRHASSVYAMLEGWELTQSPRLLASIRRALAYLAHTLIKRYPQEDGRVLAFNVDVRGEIEEIKLGANAVSLLAFVKYDELTGDAQYRTLMEQLALGIAHMQDAASGKFVHVLQATDLSVKEAFRIVYYDGEAAFGLMRLYGLSKDARWLAVVEKAFEYFLTANHWQHHDHWLSYCVNELTLYRPEEKYFRFGVQNIADHLNFIQQRETTYPTLLELSMAFAAMLQRLENNHPEMRHVLDGLDIDQFHRALHHRAHYLLNGFFWPELAMYFAKPQSILGSFFIRHHSFRVRIDDIEHYLSGFVAYWKMLSAAASNNRQPGSGSGSGNRSASPASSREAATSVKTATTAKTANHPARYGSRKPSLFKLPACLHEQKNGELDGALLANIRGGRLLKQVARQWNAMRAAALQEGLVLLPMPNGSYSSLAAQEQNFRANYQQCAPNESTAPAALSWQGHDWILKEGARPAAVPGTSDYGWGIAIDVALDRYGLLKQWLLKHAVNFGFDWPHAAQAGRLRYFAADEQPPLLTAQNIEDALCGAWLIKPAPGFSAAGLAIAATSYKPGDVVFLGPEKKELGLSAQQLQKLSSPPAAVLTTCSADKLPSFLQTGSIPVHQVKNNDAALYRLATMLRSRFSGRMIGITGTSGKTTTTHMLAHVLAGAGKVFHTTNSINTYRGVPWNLANIPFDTDFALLEMAGGSCYMTSPLVRPEVAIITNIGPGHLESIGSLDNVARRKARIFDGLADEGVAVICHDSDFADDLIAEARRQNLHLLTYGQHPQANLRLLERNETTGLCKIASPLGPLQFSLQVDGMHMVQNALACIATALALNEDVPSLLPRLATFAAVAGRGALSELPWVDGRIALLDESYNANPLSMFAAFEAAHAHFRKNAYRRLVMILGDMLELGKDEVAYHTQLATQLQQYQPDVLLLCGPLMAHLAAIMRTQAQELNVNTREDVNAAIAWAKTELQPGDLVLVKGSHGSGLFRLVQALKSLGHVPAQS